MTLGTAIALSGAAASPSMGYHSSPATAFLMTLFNVRLGAWLPNPGVGQRWTPAKPSNALLPLFNEMFGRANGNADEERQEEEGSPVKDHGFDFGLFNTMLARC